MLRGEVYENKGLWNTRNQNNRAGSSLIEIPAFAFQAHLILHC